ARVVLRRAAGSEATRVELALEGRAGLIRGEGKARAGGRRRPARPGVDRRVRGDGVDRPGARRGRGSDVPGGVDRPHREGVRALGEARVVLRRAAGGEATRVELALEGRAGLVRGEREAGRGRA